MVDKHSTGGVGDNVSLMLAPIVAACGGYVPMISGRGLGHTGGTLDKMDTIPGYVTQPDNDLFRKVVREVGCAIIGQTADLAPADKRFYAIRDVTATVEIVPLITASILSKKLAAGLGGLVMDVKIRQRRLHGRRSRRRWSSPKASPGLRARRGLACHALITDMNQPLASAAGNALEVANAVDFLTGAPSRRAAGDGDAGAGRRDAGARRAGAGSRRRAGHGAARRWKAAAAAEVFGRMVAALGGPGGLRRDPRPLPCQGEVHPRGGGARVRPCRGDPDRARSGSPWSSSAADAAAPRTRSTPRSG